MAPQRDANGRLRSIPRAFQRHGGRRGDALQVGNAGVHVTLLAPR